MSQCNLQDCDEKHFGNGYCSTHNERWKRGDRGERLERPIGADRRGGRPYGFVSTAQTASESPSLKEIHWLTGLLEGEGSFTKGQKMTSATVTVSMTDKEPLAKALKFFGGKLYGPYTPKNPKHSQYWRWCAFGPRALGIAQTTYPLLSPRRQGQIKTMIKNTIRREE